MFEERSPDSPIWDSRIVAIETYYDSDHAYIQKNTKTPNEWECDTQPNISTRGACLEYTTEEIMRMLDNHPNQRAAGPYRQRSRGMQEEKIYKADVVSVLLFYDGRYVYFDREKQKRSFWMEFGGGRTLSTFEVKAILAST